MSGNNDVANFTARYTISPDIIGDGGYGIVHRGLKKSNKEQVAIKRILRSNYDPKDLPRLAVEIENEVRLVMELARGEELFTLIQQQRTLPESITRTFTHQLLLALQYIHSQNIVFRDIKPENLLLKEPFAKGNYHLMLCDFGLAVVKGEEKAYGAFGSIYYIAPEALQPKEYDEKVDIWATGIVAHACVAGFPPFCTDKEDNNEIMALIQNTELDLNIPELKHCSGDFREFLKRTVCKDPTTRLSSTDALKHIWINRTMATAANNAKAPIHRTNPNIKFTNYSSFATNTKK